MLQVVIFVPVVFILVIAFVDDVVVAAAASSCCCYFLSFVVLFPVLLFLLMMFLRFCFLNVDGDTFCCYSLCTGPFTVFLRIQMYTVPRYEILKWHVVAVTIHTAVIWF